MSSSYRSSRLITTVPGLLAVVLAAHACSVPEQAVFADRAENPESGVLATYGESESITENEVVESVAAELLAVDRQRNEILQQGLEQLVAERLIEMEAAARGMTPDEVISTEVEAKAAEPTAEEIDAFYEERKAQIRQPKENVEEQIKSYMLQERMSELHGTFIDQLKTKYGYHGYLEPFRVEVDSAGYPVRGATDARVTIVEFSDFECPYCSRVNPTLEQILDRYSDEVRLVFRQFPLLSIHPNAQKAAEASLCAGDQGKFWEMHDLMFKEQRSLGPEDLKEKAARLELDTEAFNNCLDSSQYADAVAADLDAGGKLGVTGTPALFINGRFLSGAQPFEEIAKIIEDELASSN